MTTSAGTLPFRKPGIFISRASSFAVVVSAVSTAPGSTSTSTRTRDRSSSVVVVFTAMGRMTLLAWLYTGPLGHLYGTTADIVVLWTKWAWSRARQFSRL